MKSKKQQLLFSGLTIVTAAAFTNGCAIKSPLLENASSVSNLSAIDEFTLAGDRHFVEDYEPIDEAGHINVVVEIPTGTNAKWEANKVTGDLDWEFKNGEPRVVSYLGYPGNYGMIPRTLLSKELGGDGDPLDVLVLGPAIERGSVISVRPIGVLKLLDGGEQDDKIVAVSMESKLGGMTSIKELQQNFAGVTDIIEIWFENYKGPGEIKSNGYSDASASLAVIDASIKAYEKAVEK